MKEENKNLITQTMNKPTVKEYMSKAVKYGTMGWKFAGVLLCTFWAYTTIKRDIPQELEAMAQNRKKTEIESIIIDQADEQLSQEEIKEIKHKLFEIEKERAMKKAAKEVEKKFLGKTIDEL